MSAQVKKAGRIGTKIVAAFLFLFLVIFNVEVGLYDGESPESSILGLTLSVFVPETVAGGGSDPVDCDENCNMCTVSRSCGSHPADYVSCSGHKCERGAISVTCDGITTYC